MRSVHRAERKRVPRPIAALVGYTHAGQDRRIIEVWNKMDLLEPAQREALRSKIAAAEPPAALVSAATGEGVPALLEAIEAKLMGGRLTIVVDLRPDQLSAATWL